MSFIAVAALWSLFAGRVDAAATEYLGETLDEAGDAQYFHLSRSVLIVNWHGHAASIPRM